MNIQYFEIDSANYRAAKTIVGSLNMHGDIAAFVVDNVVVSITTTVDASLYVAANMDYIEAKVIASNLNQSTNN